jgi:O-antigen ligase
MTRLRDAASRPIAAHTHGGATRSAGVTAATTLTVYIVLLFAVPSSTSIAALGGLGRPAQLWGLFLLFWWTLSRLQSRTPGRLVSVPQPVRYALAALVVVALVSFAAALLRGQPADQVSPATTALLRLASWSGVLLVAMDGIRTFDDVARLIRRLALAGAAMAALGTLQFFTGQTWLDWMVNIPGLAFEGTDAAVRGSFTRASGTAIHPLEYGTAVVAAIPLAITTAVNKGFRTTPSRYAGWWWGAVAVIMFASTVSVSRSALIGLVVAVVFSLPAIPALYRWLIGIGGGIIAIGIFAFVPGMFGTVMNLFAGASDDPSTQSRTAALARVPEFLSSSPFIGQGFGTFLPRYYIFDNAWVLLLVELGFLGAFSLAMMVLIAIGTAIASSRRSPFEDMGAMGRGLAASLLTISVLLIFFDGLSFPISAGLFFLMIGLTASVRTVAVADTDLAGAVQHVSRPEPAPSAAVLPPAKNARRESVT